MKRFFIVVVLAALLFCITACANYRTDVAERVNKTFDSHSSQLKIVADIVYNHYVDENLISEQQRKMYLLNFTDGTIELYPETFLELSDDEKTAVKQLASTFDGEFECIYVENDFVKFVWNAAASNIIYSVSGGAPKYLLKEGDLGSTSAVFTLYRLNSNWYYARVSG
jgi:hypothetical protein